MSTPETPSTRQWWVLPTIAKRPPSTPLDQPDLPDRLAAVQALREDPRRERSQLLLAARGREGGVADVVVEVQVGVVDPDGAALARGGRSEASGGSAGPGGAARRCGRGTPRSSGAGPSNSVVEATCMWAGPSSRCRNEVSSPLSRSPVGHGANLLTDELRGRVSAQSLSASVPWVSVRAPGAWTPGPQRDEAGDADAQQPHRRVELEALEQVARHSVGPCRIAVWAPRAFASACRCETGAAGSSASRCARVRAPSARPAQTRAARRSSVRVQHVGVGDVLGEGGLALSDFGSRSV